MRLLQSTKVFHLAKASANYNIPVSTLHDHTSGKLQFVKGHPTALSNEEEEYIVRGLEYAAESGWPLNRNDLKNMVAQFSNGQSMRTFPKGGVYFAANTLEGRIEH
jgi:hypothetical protein